MITMTKETEAQIQIVAAHRGVSAEEALSQLVAEAVEVSGAVAGLHRGTAEIAAGDWVSLDELRCNLDEQAGR